MTLNLEKLSEVLGDYRDSHDYTDDWLEWCDLHEVTVMTALDVEYFWNEGKENTVCVDVGNQGWLVMPKEFAEKVLVLGIP